jgi:hypothetical protein
MASTAVIRESHTFVDGYAIAYRRPLIALFRSIDDWGPLEAPVNDSVIERLADPCPAR